MSDFSKKMDSKEIDNLSIELKRFVDLKKTVMSKYAETVDFSKYEFQLKKILGDYISSEEVEVLTKPINLSNDIEFNQFIEDERNGLSDKSKAEAIAYQTKKTISENFDKDREFYGKFSDKIKSLLADIKNCKIEDIKSLLESVKECQKKVADYEDSDIPEAIYKEKKYHPFYRMIVSTLKNVDSDIAVNISKAIYSIINNNIIVDWHLNSSVKRNIEFAIDDYLYDIVKLEYNIVITSNEMNEIISRSWEIATQNRSEL